MSNTPESSRTPVYYNKGGLSPFDVIRAWGLDFFEGNVVKYICRWKEKGGVGDLEKARDYLNELISQHNAELLRDKILSVATGVNEVTFGPVMYPGRTNLTLSTYEEDDEKDPFSDPGWFEQGGE